MGSADRKNGLRMTRRELIRYLAVTGGGLVATAVLDACAPLATPTPEDSSPPTPKPPGPGIREGSSLGAGTGIKVEALPPPPDIQILGKLPEKMSSGWLEKPYITEMSGMYVQVLRDCGLTIPEGSAVKVKAGRELVITDLGQKVGLERFNSLALTVAQGLKDAKVKWARIYYFGALADGTWVGGSDAPELGYAFSSVLGTPIPIRRGSDTDIFIHVKGELPSPDLNNWVFGVEKPADWIAQLESDDGHVWVLEETGPPGGGRLTQTYQLVPPAVRYPIEVSGEVTAEALTIGARLSKVLARAGGIWVKAMDVYLPRVVVAAGVVGSAYELYRNVEFVLETMNATASPLFYSPGPTNKDHFTRAEDLSEKYLDVKRGGAIGIGDQWSLSWAGMRQKWTTNQLSRQHRNNPVWICLGHAPGTITGNFEDYRCDRTGALWALTPLSFLVAPDQEEVLIMNLLNESTEPVSSQNPGSSLTFSTYCNHPDGEGVSIHQFVLMVTPEGAVIDREPVIFDRWK